MGKRVMDRDPVTGKETVFHWNEHDDNYAVEDRQDVTGIIKDATAKRNETDRNTRYGNGMTQVASIPMNMYHDWVRKGYTKDQKKMKKLLNSPDLRKFRTRQGKV
tara:strand:+ start:1666 stop:1980 length:315 start_codon:yes stop_codon:yes gene_type:complete